MSADEQNSTTTTSAATTAEAAPVENLSTEAIIEKERSDKILKAKELYSQGSRNFLVKSYAEAADELSQVCALYGELYGELADELGMPYLLYAKSLIALGLEENKVIDVPDEEEDDDEEDEDGGEDEGEAEAEEAPASSSSATNGKEAKKTAASSNGKDLDTIKEDAADSTAAVEGESVAENKEKSSAEEEKKSAEEAQVTSTDDNDDGKKKTNGEATKAAAASTSNGKPVMDGEKPSTSNGEAGGSAETEEEDENASNLQLAWEILELAAKIFEHQGEGGLANLAEVQTELANIQFEDNILEASRADYEKALEIYKQLPTNYRRAMAEIHYKIGLTYLMQQLNKEGAGSLKEACKLIEGEIQEMKSKTDLTEKDKNNIQDMEETKQEIEAKITEIEETQAQNLAEVRAALDSYIKPMSSGDADAGTSAAGASSSTVSSASPAKSSVSPTAASAITSSSKPTDISHLIKRKKPEEPSSEAEAANSPAKRPAV